MEETIGQNVNVSVGEFKLCVIGVPYILAGCELQDRNQPEAILLYR